MGAAAFCRKNIGRFPYVIYIYILIYAELISYVHAKKLADCNKTWYLSNPSLQNSNASQHVYLIYYY